MRPACAQARESALVVPLGSWQPLASAIVSEVRSDLRDEPAEQTRQRDLHFTGLPERLFEDEGRAYAGRRQQRIQD